MNHISDKNWYSMGDTQILKQIGEFVKHHRMEQNKTQTVLAKDAGIGRSTLSLLERGETVTVATLIRVLRVLEKLDIVNEFLIHTPQSPLLLAGLEKKGKRQRASSGKKEDADRSADDLNW